MFHLHPLVCRLRVEGIGTNLKKLSESNSANLTNDSFSEHLLDRLILTVVVLKLAKVAAQESSQACGEMLSTVPGN